MGAPYQSWLGLKGKTVGTRLGTGSEQVLRRYFELNDDLAWEDFEWVNLKIEDMIAALNGGRIEAFTAWEPTCSIAEAQGTGRILRTYGDVASVPVCFNTTVSFARDHRSEVVRFLAVHIEKAALIRNHPDRAARLAMKAASERGCDVKSEAFHKVFNKIDFSVELYRAS